MDRGPRDHFTGSHYVARRSRGPLPFLNPTQRVFPFSGSDAKAPSRIGAPDSDTGADEPAPESSARQLPGAQQQQQNRPQRGSRGMYNVWRSRDNRKGRHTLVVSKDYAETAGITLPSATNTVRETWRGIIKMFVRYPIWDVSYDVAVVFTWGSVVWVINGFFAWLPVVAPSTEFPGETDMGAGVTAFIGATIFEFGSVLMMLEAVNENRSDCFGWALEEALEGGRPSLSTAHDCHHHHNDRRSFLRPSRGQKKPAADDRETATNDHAAQDDQGSKAKGDPSSRNWSWWPTWYELSTHYFRDIGFLACFSQMIGATVFWISGLTGLPPILNALSVPATNGIYWLPQVVGGSGFIISSILLMVEVQKKWYLPAPTVLGWYVGLFNLIGAIGFTLCGALGFGIDQEGVEYASTLSTYIGSWAFLIGSIAQWYESLDKYPITVVDTSNESLYGDEEA